LNDRNQLKSSETEMVRQEKIRKIIEAADFRYAKLFQYLFTDHPELNILDIEIATKEQYPVLEYTGGFWRRPDINNPNPRVFIEVSGTKHYEHLLKDRELSARAAAEMIGIDFSVIQQHPEVLSMFIFLHEVGHADDYIKNYLNNPNIDDPVVVNLETKKNEVNSLPIPGVSSADAKKLENSGKLAEYYQKFRLFYEAKGIFSPEELLKINEIAYRKLPSESYADNFAAQTLRAHWNDLGFGLFGTPSSKE
jgi:hypothetical protein